MDSSRNPHSRPPPKPPPSPVFRIRPPPHSPIPRSGFDADQAGITAQVCVHCGIGIPIRLICTTASDEPGTYPHTFSTAHSPSPTSQSKSRLHLFLPPHPPPLSLRSPRTSPSPLPLSPCRRRILIFFLPRLPAATRRRTDAESSPARPPPPRVTAFIPRRHPVHAPSRRTKEGPAPPCWPESRLNTETLLFFRNQTTDDYPFQLRHDTFPETTPAHPCGSRLRVCWRKD